MSLSRIVLRMLAVKALTNRTMAGGRVSDSAMDPIDVTITEAHLPLITVVTDDDLTTGKGRDLNGDERSLDLVVEVAVASSVSQGEVTIPQTDFGLEWSIDIMEYQIDRALFGGQNAASQALMKLVPRIHRKGSRRGATAEKGIRFAARQIVYTLDPVCDPMPGRKIDTKTAFGAALEFLAADPDTAEVAGMLRTMIEQPELSVLASSMVSASITDEGAEAIRIADLGDGAILEETTVVDGDGNVIVHDVIRAAGAELKGGASASATATKV